MDRQSLIGMVLIGLMVSLWVFYSSVTSRRDVTPEHTKRNTEKQDSAEAAMPGVTEKPASLQVDNRKAERLITIETDLLRVTLSSHGGTIASWQLLEYSPWYAKRDTSVPVDLITEKARELNFDFMTINGSRVKGSDLEFEFTSEDKVVLGDKDSVTITLRSFLSDRSSIERSFTFRKGRYDVRTSLTLDGMDSLIPTTNRYVTLGWNKGIRFQEENSVDESNNAVAMASFNGDIEEYDVSEFNLPEERQATGRINFLATRTKYFAVVMVQDNDFDGTAYYGGVKYGAPDNGVIKQYALKYKLPYHGGRQTHSLTLFAGPMEYDVLKDLGLSDIMNFGWKLIVKPIGEYFMLPTLRFVRSFIPNYGIAIVIFSIIMKLLLYPLSIQQMKSAQKMQLLGPVMSGIREKYKDDMKLQQQEMMKVYGEYGINPAGGCLPLVLQMPILYSLYSVLNLNIELRQAEFLPVWITDLSIPDVVLELPFKLPFIGMDKFSGLALLMGITLFIQQKMTVTDPRQKALMYMMPVMLTLIFSTLPAGLNLYYFMFNLMSITQQVYMNKFSPKRPTLEDLRRSPKKEGWLQRKMREAQDMAAAQGRSIPGTRNKSQNQGDSKPRNTRQRKRR